MTEKRTACQPDKTKTPAAPRADEPIPATTSCQSALVSGRVLPICRTNELRRAGHLSDNKTKGATRRRLQ
jgi:hypothetical protein